MTKVFDRAKLRMNRLVAAFFGTNGPRAAGFAGRRFARIVLSFPVRVTNWMNRRKVKNIESHFGDFGQYLLAVFEGAAGAREHFVPGAETRANRIDGHTQLAGMRGVSSI